MKNQLEKNEENAIHDEYKEWLQTAFTAKMIFFFKRQSKTELTEEEVKQESLAQRKYDMLIKERDFEIENVRNKFL